MPADPPVALASAAAHRPPRQPALPALLLALVLGFGLALLAVLWLPAALAGALAIGLLPWLTRQPQWLLAALTLTLAIPVQRELAGVPVNAADLLLVLWCLLWPWMRLRSAAPRLPRWCLPTAAWAILPFLGMALIAQALSIDAVASAKQVLRIVEWFIVLPLLLLVFRPDPRFWHFTGLVLMLVPSLFALDGLIEVATNGRSLSGMLGIPVPLPPGDREQIRHTFDISGRAGSTFGGAQGLAMYLVMSMSVVIAHLLRPPTPWLRQLAWICLLICSAGLVATQSRGGVLGVLTLLAVMGMAIHPLLRRWLPLGAILGTSMLIGLLAFWPGWDGSLTGLIPGRPEAVWDRLIIWGVVREVVLAHPFFGLGLGNFRDAFFEINPWLYVELGYYSVHAHNTYFEILTGTGLFGLLAYLGFLVVVGTRLLRLWAGGTGAAPTFTLAAIGILAAYVVFAMVDMLLLQNLHLLLLLVLCLGLTEQGAPAPGLAQDPSQGLRYHSDDRTAQSP